MLEVSYTIDWFNFTITDKSSTRMGNVDNTYVDGKGMNGYTISARYIDGRIENHNPDRPEMGKQIIFSGSALTNFKDMYGKSVDDVLSHYACFGGKCTRLDIAIDVRNSGLKFGDLVTAIEKDEITTKVPRSKIHYHKGVVGQGWTIYLGKKSKHRFMRIYHKGIEQGTNEDWIRIELQCNVKTAQRYHLGYVDAKDKASYVKSVIKGYVNFDKIELWNTITGDEKMTLSSPQKDGSKTMEWLLNSVAPFLGRYIARYGNDVLERFLLVVDDEKNEELKRLK